MSADAGPAIWRAEVLIGHECPLQALGLGPQNHGSYLGGVAENDLMASAQGQRTNMDEHDDDRASQHGAYHAPAEGAGAVPDLSWKKLARTKHPSLFHTA